MAYGSKKNGIAKEAYPPGYFSDRSKGLGVHTSSEAVLSVGEAKTCGRLGMMVGGWVIHETKLGTLNTGLKKNVPMAAISDFHWFPWLLGMHSSRAFKELVQGTQSLGTKLWLPWDQV